MNRLSPVYLMFACVVVLLVPLTGDTQNLAHIPGKVSKSAAEALDGAMGSWSPEKLRKLASSLSLGDIVAAFYDTDRGRRLIALEVAGYLTNPWPVLPYLAVFMETQQRQVSSHAAYSLIMSLERANTRGGSISSPNTGEVDQLAEMLVKVATNGSVQADIRVIALEAVQLLEIITENSQGVPLELFEDEEAIVRSAVLAMLAAPLDDKQVAAVAVVATSDKDGYVQGQAVGLLCENALSHDVKKPSKDLQELIADFIDDESSEESIAPVMGCLARLPYQARTELTDLILKHANPKVEEFWQLLIK